jgi:hypothetical protein
MKETAYSTDQQRLTTAVVWSRGKRRAKERSVVPPARQPTRRPGARKISRKIPRMLVIVYNPLHDYSPLCWGRDRLDGAEKYDRIFLPRCVPIRPVVTTAFCLNNVLGGTAQDALLPWSVDRQHMASVIKCSQPRSGISPLVPMVCAACRRALTA